MQLISYSIIILQFAVEGDAADVDGGGVAIDDDFHFRVLSGSVSLHGRIGGDQSAGTSSGNEKWMHRQRVP